MNNKGLQQQLLEAFKIEAEERLQSLFSSLAEMEKNPSSEKRKQLIEVVFRHVHSLKGAARSVNIPDIEALCQEMEGIFSAVKEGRASLSTRMLDTFHEAAGSIERYLAASADDLPGLRAEMTELKYALSAFKAGMNKTKPLKKNIAKADLARSGLKQRHQSAPLQHARPLFSETVRISIAKLDSLLLKTEELITLKQILNQHLHRIRKAEDGLLVLKKQWELAGSEIQKRKKRLSGRYVENRFLQFWESSHTDLQNTSNEINALIKTFEQSNRLLGKMVDDLLDEMKKASLLPFSTLFSILPRMVREIAGKQGKAVDLEFLGEDVEIDKRILENIKDPLIHLLRNAVDHGIEAPEIRKQKQKPARGLIRLVVSQPENNRVKLEVSDDGEGINPETLMAKAIKQGVLTPENADKIKDADLHALVFQSGISTSPIISEISGRGLGMAIVKDGIESLGGSISIASSFGSGTTFTIQLPVTLATLRGILVSVSGHYFLIPNIHVAQSLKIRPDDIQSVENRTVISINSCAVSLVNLSDVLGLPPKTDAAAKGRKPQNRSMLAVVLTASDQKIAFIVDEILNEQAVLVKTLGKQLKRVPNISGATILGSGYVVPVINVNDLIRTASGISPSRIGIESTGIKTEKPKSILIVEDSLTARTLLKNILEASGYAVKTAVNGQDGLNQLKSKPFHAVVSDVEMPLMDGFELTKKIREDSSLTEIPVILVTNMDSPIDRERGIDAGADAYIVKSHFDRSNLLEVIEGLI